MLSSLIVEAIVGRKVFSGKVLYLTKWKDSHECTWESVKLLKNYRNLIKQYNLHNRNKHHCSEDDEEDKNQQLCK